MMPVNLDEIMAEVMTISDKEIKDRNAQVEIQSPLKPVVANPTTMGQILANMVSNALKFVEPGKKPVVKIRTEQGASADRVRLIVEDNGIGIEQTHQKKIFGLFERLHNSSMYPGTGVGLAIVRKGTERMGGSVGLESAPGAGSRFWIELPAV
jgi:signal transduction histidine kinase